MIADFSARATVNAFAGIKGDFYRSLLAFRIMAPDARQRAPFKKMTERIPGPSSRLFPLISRMRGL